MLTLALVYAVSHRDRPQSTILYPTSHPGARETRIQVTDPVYGRRLGEVCLRPVDLKKIELLIADKTISGRRRREQYAIHLALDGDL
jgi:5-methylcytosine-specific restriction enzyme subunit McrC